MMIDDGNNKADIGAVLFHSTETQSVAYNSSICEAAPYQFHDNYRQFSNISRTQSQNINVSRLVLQLSSPIPLKPGVKLRMKM